MRTQRFVFFFTMAALATALAGAVFATPGSGVLSSTGLARAAFQVPVNIKVKVEDGRQEVIHVPDTRENVIQQIILGSVAVPAGTVIRDRRWR